MTEKVVLTKEQAEAIKVIHEQIVNTELGKLTTQEIAKGIVGMYEVEPEFKVGDWVVTKDGMVAEIIDVCMFHKDSVALYGVDGRHTFDTLRHATPQEITEEKQLRWWKKQGREPWELRKDDCLISKSDKHSCNVKFVEDCDEVSVLLVDGIQDEFYEGEHDLQIMRDRYEVFCFAEDRKDV